MSGPPALTHLKYIDALRGIAILLVILCHVFIAFPELDVPGLAGTFLWQANRGVQLFYIISAFTLFYSYKEKNWSWQEYFVRRFFRIAPMFYVAVIVYTIFFVDGISASVLVKMFTFTNGIDIYNINAVFPGSWSIAVEFPFYIVLFLLLTRINNLTQSVNFFLVSCVIAFLLNALLRRTLDGPEEVVGLYLYFYLPSQAPVFALGVVLYFLVVRNETRVAPLTLLLLGFLVSLHIAIGGKGLIEDHVQLSIGFAIVTLALARFPVAVIVNAFTSFIGKISFSLYLTHFMVIYGFRNVTVFNLTDSGLLNYVIAFSTIAVIAGVLSTITYYAIEKPMMKVGTLLLRQRAELPLGVEGK
jgi:peptidoglycan/LPS O-acetylase OafA/YrhL